MYMLIIDKGECCMGYRIAKVSKGKVEFIEKASGFETKEEIIEYIKDDITRYEDYLKLYNFYEIMKSLEYQYYIDASISIANEQGSGFVPSVKGFHAFFKKGIKEYASALEHIFE